jgi:hypothetical protein
MTHRLAEYYDHGRCHSFCRTLFACLGLALLGLCLLAAPAQAQDEEPEPTRYEDVAWNQVVLVDFKAGREERAMEIIEDRFLPVAKKAGNQIPRTVEMQTGPWDLLLVWTLQDGPSEMTWEISPEEIETMKAAQEMFGQEKMEKISDEYSSLIARETSFVGFSGRHGAPVTAQLPE